MIRRQTVIAILLATTMALSGCSVITGDGATYVAEDIGIDESTVSETNFTLDRTEWQNRSRDVEIAGEERTINVSTKVKAYIWGEQRGAFAALATPTVSVAGQKMNPIEDLSREEVIQRLESGFDGQGEIESLEQSEEYTVEAAGEERTVTVFSATATREGQERDIQIHVTKFTDGEDIIIGAGVHAADAEQIREDTETMLEGIDH